MENNAKKLRCLALGNMVGSLVMGDKRDPEKVASVLQVVNNTPDFESRLAVDVVAVDTSEIREELILWQKFDKKFFPDVNVGNYTSLRIPQNPPADFTLPIVNARGITAKMLVARMRMEFDVWIDNHNEFGFGTSVDIGSVHSDRMPVSSSYIVLVRDCDEVDEDLELEGKSAIVIAEEAIPTETLEERLRHGFYYWWKTGKHLDVVNATLAASSRNSRDCVPIVYRGSGLAELYVDWRLPGHISNRLRARAVFI